ncbi:MULTISPECIES: TetR family transcriptional regulator [Kingella]|uniref:TetR family transcriptional regulator n=1 Tax=Kingella bonacorsii TaxID=2796361 RepID=A0ABS1BPD0_9NEIS|nr:MULTISPECIES: TetR family transcriptional regulator [Kingella]MBK0395068.1 TetR family transcriptional regulator [Kingella bonacorsii]
MRKTKTEAQKTHQHLLDAALEVFWRDGVTRASLQAIAQEAGVTRGALYWHFKNKEDLFETLFEQQYADFFAAFNDQTLRDNQDVWTHLQHNLTTMFETLATRESKHKFCNVMFSKCEQTAGNETITELACRYHRLFQKQIAYALQLSREQGRLPENTDIELAAIYLESSLVGLIKIWIDEPERFDLIAKSKRVIAANMRVLQQGLA